MPQCSCCSNLRSICTPQPRQPLGSLFCEIAGWDRQIIVETHSDYLLDRVRMDVRDKKTNLKSGRCLNPVF